MGFEGLGLVFRGWGLGLVLPRATGSVTAAFGWRVSGLVSRVWGLGFGGWVFRVWD